MKANVYGYPKHGMVGKENGTFIGTARSKKELQELIKRAREQHKGVAVHRFNLVWAIPVRSETKKAA